ncbi:hypothetical protein B0A48_10410 [Cryoendolithus antarcticus]|uniref:ATP-dependent RNA helicase n=1 Tax=Cryoendolithus antarcticus TaxID=1507870 RepID=A0A1V8SXI3_9PEZI|nr:hypothetical protein B0A48_10410 [Cryoendolithus antarcticus]
MAATSNKRPLPAKVAAMRDRKRQKLDQDAPSPQEGLIAAAAKPRKVHDLNKLAWKDVSLPDRLDNYEGFFGLEEIEDVVVTREPGSGKVSFVSQHAGEATMDDLPEADDPASVQEGDEEWSGFDDDDAVTAPLTVLKPTALAVKASKQAKPEKKAKAKVKGQTDLEAKSKGSSKPAAVLQTLEATADEVDVDMSAWLPLKLSPDTMAALAKLKFATPSTIQQSAIPPILAGHDVIGKASTGSGKTLAFGIPILEHYLDVRQLRTTDETKAPIALILSPTRELAHQLNDHLTALCSTGVFDAPSIATVTGGLSVQKQQRQLRYADIIIGTPGRLWEVMSAGKGLMNSIRQIQFLVIDEADRLLSEGNFKEVIEILTMLDKKDTDKDAANESEEVAATPSAVSRQTLVFSATFDRGLQKKLSGKIKNGGALSSNKDTMEYLLGKLNFREETPKFIDANPISQMASGLKEGLIECAGPEKDLYLYSLLLLYRNARTLVFCNSISAVRRLNPFLQNLDLPVVALHSGMTQKARLRSVERFSQKGKEGGKTASIMVSTDVAARGLDIPAVQLVIHYHLPRAADMYVHRSGRTARAGQPGSSILICGPEEVGGVRRLVAKVHARSAGTDDESAASAKKQGYYIRTLDMDRRIVSRLRPRAQLAKKLADIGSAKEKGSKEDDFMRAAAEELGVDYDSEEFEKEAPGRHGRGAGRKKKEKVAREISKGEAGSMRAELRELLRQRVNVGVSEKYITSGSVDVDELLKQKEIGERKTGEFLGNAGGVGLEDL